jgi:tRNA-Thr(GGU) m(6)t(6)A37 methyltransferase TsaA
MSTFTMRSVGTMRNTRTDPGNSDHWGAVVSTIELNEELGDQCLLGLDNFSHVEVLFVFHQAAERDDYTGGRHPRGRQDLPAVGLFADRGPRRPNRIGATICEIVAVDRRRLQVRSLDAVDRTPVLDLKPVMHEFLPPQTRQPQWVGQLMSEYFRD